ncbi:hypothetical protein ACIRON_02980 [Nocardioides sp. NPDC101246]|uniref:hypothetical protein n=1 Tax=Nocardioides sp. NPDC101246 TaxID=3364336 RepID=UPI003828573F
MTAETLAGLVFFGSLFSVIGLVALGLQWHDGWRPHFMHVRHGRSLQLLGVDRGRCRDCSRSASDAAVTDCGRCWEHCPRCARREADDPARQVAAMEREMGIGGSR